MTIQIGDPENVADVRRVFDRWIAAIQSRNLDGVVAQHSSGMVMFDVPMPPSINGLDAYRETWTPFFRWFGDRGVFESSELLITAGEDVAFSHCLIRCEGSQGEGSYLPVRLTLCYHKVDDQWLIAHEHHSVPFETTED
jgi:ketosteroid isomerase-like protein